MRFDTDRAHARSTAAVRDTERLVQIHVRNVGTDLRRPTDTDHGIEVRAVHVHLPTALVHDSAEKPVRAFRDRLRDTQDLEDREAFLAYMEPFVGKVDPLRFARGVDPDDVLLVSGRFDRVVPPARTEALWQALGKPTWKRFPAGHYQHFLFFYWAAAQ